MMPFQSTAMPYSLAMVMVASIQPFYLFSLFLGHHFSFARSTLPPQSPSLPTLFDSEGRASLVGACFEPGLDA
jgi:hypothetical protein